MLLQPGVFETLDVDCRHPQDILYCDIRLTQQYRGLRGIDKPWRRGRSGMKPYQRPTPGRQQREAVVRSGTPYLLRIENACGELCALAEAEQAHPLAAAAAALVVVEHRCCNRGVNVVHNGAGVLDWVVGPDAQPGLEWAVVLVHGSHVGPGLRWEGCFGEDEAEAGVQGAVEHAALHAENARVGATVMETHDVWEVKGWVVIVNEARAFGLWLELGGGNNERRKRRLCFEAFYWRRAMHGHGVCMLLMV